MSETLNGDLSQRVTVDTQALEWAASPSGTVWRKRLHLVGPAEAGQVTSIVRYQAEATFSVHYHPDGEEILVLEGIFSDEHGDWPAGTYLLNPEGFRHAPFSREGCLLFVKLRQYPGDERQHIVIDTKAMDWTSTEEAGVEVKQLYKQAGFVDTVCLERWTAGAQLNKRTYEQGVEYFVLEGSFADEAGYYGTGSWLRLPSGASHQPNSTEGCLVYCKRAGLAYLQSVEA